MIKASIDIIMKGFIKVFNAILKSGFFPNPCEGLINPIFKSGNRSDPGNYRGICVSNCLGKLVCLTLNEKIMSYVKTKNIIHQSQIGFMPDNRTANIYLYIKNTP